MLESIEKACSVLAKRDENWVNRRDAAETLGKGAARAVEALRAHADDEDVDVRMAVEKSLGWAEAGLEGVRPVPQERAFTLDELVKDLERPGRREVAEKDGGYEITVDVGKGRSQRVRVEAAKSRADKETVRVSTRCGKVTDRALRWALRNNTSFSYCALALSEEDGEEMFIMVNSFLADAVTPAELKASVKEVAFYGDWVESKLGDGDEF